MAQSVDSDQTASSEVVWSDLGLHGLHMQRTFTVDSIDPDQTNVLSSTR